jgi:hypothetical protein
MQLQAVLANIEKQHRRGSCKWKLLSYLEPWCSTRARVSWTVPFSIRCTYCILRQGGARGHHQRVRGVGQISAWLHWRSLVPSLILGRTRLLVTLGLHSTQGMPGMLEVSSNVKGTSSDPCQQYEMGGID